MSDNSSGETNVPIGEWTIGSLKVYHDGKIVSLKENIEQRLVDMEKAVVKAEIATEKRFESVNEFRGQLSDQSNTLMPRAEYNAKHQSLEEKISDLTDRINLSEGSLQGSRLTTTKFYSSLAATVAIITIVVAVANGLFK